MGDREFQSPARSHGPNLWRLEQSAIETVIVEDAVYSSRLHRRLATTAAVTTTTAAPTTMVHIRFSCSSTTYTDIGDILISVFRRRQAVAQDDTTAKMAPPPKPAANGSSYQLRGFQDTRDARDPHCRRSSGKFVLSWRPHLWAERVSGLPAGGTG